MSIRRIGKAFQINAPLASEKSQALLVNYILHVKFSRDSEAERALQKAKFARDCESVVARCCLNFTLGSVVCALETTEH